MRSRSSSTSSSSVSPSSSDALHLLAEDQLALVLALVRHHARDLALHAQQLELLGDHREHEAHALPHVEGGEDALFVAHRHVVDGEVRRDEVGERAALADVLEDAAGLLGEVRHQVQELTRSVAQLRAEAVELGVPLEVLGDAADLGAHVRLEADLAREPQARQAMEHDRVVRRSEANDLYDAGHRPHIEDILEARLVDVGVPLAHDPHDGAILSEEVLDQADATRPAHVDGDDARREDHAVAQREDRQGLEIGTRLLSHFSSFMMKSWWACGGDPFGE